MHVPKNDHLGDTRKDLRNAVCPTPLTHTGFIDLPLCRNRASAGHDTSSQRPILCGIGLMGVTP